MILNSNTLNKINKKMIIEITYDKAIISSPIASCALYQWFSINNKIQRTLDETTDLQNKKAIYEFNSISSYTDYNSCEYSTRPKFVTLYSPKERDILIKKLYSLALACKYPAFLKINDNYCFLNELKFTEYDKKLDSELVYEKYDELDCFIIENLYGLDALKRNGYEKDGKQYKMIR